ncbi:MAG TPA: 4-(cytidine 5'-diphospho)-2-C-methyl-D-erythritol kinase [Pyrinomonadaceae bacterium]|nr:4-(cytidine 5'-diphospho)-2-C-methyl-D-erythritol kinase [Pyrinomonadaceae bacterium]
MVNEAFTLPSFAKVNFVLRVLGKRDDGFHDLCTVFQTVSLHDALTFSPAEHIEFKCSDPRIPVGDENIVVRAANTLKDRFGVSAGAEIHLEKTIPSPGGLGGGSSNAAVALVGLSRHWKLDASISDLHLISAELGSDVPYFLHGGTAIGTGRGELIESIDDVDAKFMVIVTPDVVVHTREAFAGLNAPSLTKSKSETILNVCRLELESLDLLHPVLKNDFETAIFAAYPEIERVKNTLVDLGAQQALMSGSGASVFGIFDNEQTRQQAIKALDEHVNWRVFAVATISRNEYREALMMC